MSKGTVFVVDDNDDFRTSIAWMLRGEGYQTIEFSCPQKAINALKLTEPENLLNSCILLDVRMPIMSGLEFHDALYAEKIRIPVLYMTGHGDVSLAVEAMKKGAVTLLEKPLKSEQLNLAIESALVQSSGKKVVEKVVDVSLNQRAKFMRMMESLTPREDEVLKGIVNGNANKAIAYDLNISVRTVEVHRARLMKKLGVRSVSELMKMVMACQANN